MAEAVKKNDGKVYVNTAHTFSFLDDVHTRSLRTSYNINLICKFFRRCLPCGSCRLLNLNSFEVAGKLVVHGRGLYQR